jgi:hypothetical protein
MQSVVRVDAPRMPLQLDADAPLKALGQLLQCCLIEE